MYDNSRGNPLPFPGSFPIFLRQLLFSSSATTSITIIPGVRKIQVCHYQKCVHAGYIYVRIGACTADTTTSTMRNKTMVTIFSTENPSFLISCHHNMLCIVNSCSLFHQIRSLDIRKAKSMWQCSVYCMCVSVCVFPSYHPPPPPPLSSYAPLPLSATCTFPRCLFPRSLSLYT